MYCSSLTAKKRFKGYTSNPQVRGLIALEQP